MAQRGGGGVVRKRDRERGKEKERQRQRKGERDGEIERHRREVVENKSYNKNNE